MTSARKAEANRQNAQKSTGPKTPEGKAAVSLNALKHGLLSKELLLPGEDEEALRELEESLKGELQPVGVVEVLLGDRITSLLWRLRRLGHVEVGIFALELYEHLLERARREASTYVTTPSLKDVMGYGEIKKTEITDESRHGEALAKVQEMEAARDS